MRDFAARDHPVQGSELKTQEVGSVLVGQHFRFGHRQAPCFGAELARPAQLAAQQVGPPLQGKGGDLQGLVRRQDLRHCPAMSSPAFPADAARRVADLAAVARGHGAAHVADSTSRVVAVANAARPWLLTNTAAVRDDLAQRVDRLERVGVAPSLFTLMGLSRYEKPYNRVLAWIVDPAAQHGAGRFVLRALAEHLKAPALYADLSDPDSPVEVRGEATWPEAVGHTGQPDLLVISRSFVLLIENKVTARESGDQYGPYLEALVGLAEERDLGWGAWLAAPERREIPKPDEDGNSWTGCITHSEIASVLRTAAAGPLISAWGRVACLLVAAQFDVPDGHHHGSVAAAKLLLAREDRSIAHVTRMRSLLANLPIPHLPWSTDLP